MTLIMWRKLVLLFVVAIGALSAARSYGQATPIAILYFGEKKDVEGQRFKKALENDVRLTSRFSLYTGAPYDIPKNGVTVEVFSQEISLKGGDVIGSSITIIATRPSITERGYSKFLTSAVWMLPTGDAITIDTALDFLATISKLLPN